MYFATQLISHQVVTGFPGQRMAYLAERIRTVRAQYCAVLKPETFALLGLIRFSDVVAGTETSRRTLGDLMDVSVPITVRDSDGIQEVVDVLVRHNPAELVIQKTSGSFVGLITPESFSRWLLASEPDIKATLSRLPAHSRWNPYSAPFEGSQQASA